VILLKRSPSPTLLRKIWLTLRAAPFCFTGISSLGFVIFALPVEAMPISEVKAASTVLLRSPSSPHFSQESAADLIPTDLTLTSTDPLSPDLAPQFQLQNLRSPNLRSQDFWQVARSASVAANPFKTTSKTFTLQPLKTSTSESFTLEPLKTFTSENFTSEIPTTQNFSSPPHHESLHRVTPIGLIAEADPELGELRLKPQDEEINIIIRPITPPPQKQPKPKSVFLQGRVDYFRNSNVLASDEKVADGLVRSGLTLFYAPSLGRSTFLVTSLDVGLVRYFNVARLNYDELRFRVGIYQQLSPRMSGEVGWSNQQLFTTDRGIQSIFRGNRFFNDNALRVELSRQDPLGKNLTLSSYYQFRWSTTTELEQYDRLVHTWFSSLSYSFSPDFQMALDYQFIWSHFTQQPRDDFYHQVGGRLTYKINPQTQINFLGGVTLGTSTNDRLDFNGWLFGVGLVFNLPLF
jgi:hypothetical protein